MSSLNDFVSGLLHGPQIRDWRHGNKIFGATNFGLKPKDSFLFHVSFDINSAVSRLPNQEALEVGMLVKSIQIPKYTFETKTMNEYNRTAIVQQKIKYDPISITFHDDNSDVVRDFWYNYMSHYYRDSDYTPSSYTQPTKYNKLNQNFWGYQPNAYSSNGAVERLLNTIKIYSLHQKSFTEYILINPIITGFQHGQHVQGQNEFMENTMTLAYESVLYNYGTIKHGAEPAGFATLNYDTTPSPLTPQGGGTNSIFGPGGLASAVTGVSSEVDNKNYAAAALTAARALTTASRGNVVNQAKTELSMFASGILAGDTNVLNRISLPKPQANGTNSSQQAISD